MDADWPTLVAMVIAGLGGLGGTGAAIQARRKGANGSDIHECRELFEQVKQLTVQNGKRLAKIETHIAKREAYEQGLRDAADNTGRYTAVKDG